MFYKNSIIELKLPKFLQKYQNVKINEQNNSPRVTELKYTGFMM